MLTDAERENGSVLNEVGTNKQECIIAIQFALRGIPVGPEINHQKLRRIAHFPASGESGDSGEVLKLRAK